MSGRRKVILAVVALLVVAGAAYTAYVGYEGSRTMVDAGGSDRDCRTPDVQYGWAYQAINYPISDDELLKTRNPDLTDCDYLGVPAGGEVVTDDGIRIAGWYIPAADGSPAAGPTVVLVHGLGATKSGILRYGIGLHEHFNLVVFDLRNGGRSTGDQTTGGFLERKDLRAILDWLVRTKHPAHIGVLGNSLGAVTALAEAVDDPRVEALALDSMHTRTSYQVEARLGHASPPHPAYPGTWAIFAGIWIRTGVDLPSIDADRMIKLIGDRPVLLTHGGADNEDLPERTQAFYDDAVADGMEIQLEWCPGSGHNAPAGMPAEVCADDFATWTSEFFSAALAG